ncbi:MAG: hypothetical protein AAFU67_16610, partial [Bacteroidota bacterium]
EGDLFIRLTWEQANVDLDLALASAPSFLVLPTYSGDDQDGPGEETLTWSDSAGDGEYRINVTSNTGGVANYTIFIQSANDSRTFTESIDSANPIDAYVFTKSGGLVIF